MVHMRPPPRRSSAKGLVTLHDNQATACTDVTGFGLMGHKRRSAPGCSVLCQPQNVRLRRAIRNLDAALASPLYPLLFDPQTAGGLLASVPPDRAEACLAALHTQGYDRAAIIGTVQPQTHPGEPITIVGL